MTDQVVLVDEHDRILGAMDKIEAHRGAAQLHRAISVFLFRRRAGQVELLIQQRSQHKIVGAGQWANTVCGNVWPGESYEACARRRLEHELGITAVSLHPLTKFHYQVQCNDEFSEHEIDQVYAGWYDDDVNLNPSEVMNYQWVNWTELLDSSTLEIAPWLTLLLSDGDVHKKLVTFVQRKAT